MGGLVTGFLLPAVVGNILPALLLFGLFAPWLPLALDKDVQAVIVIMVAFLLVPPLDSVSYALLHSLHPRFERIASDGIWYWENWNVDWVTAAANKEEREPVEYSWALASFYRLSGFTLFVYALVLVFYGLLQGGISTRALSTPIMVIGAGATRAPSSPGQIVTVPHLPLWLLVTVMLPVAWLAYVQSLRRLQKYYLETIPRLVVTVQSRLEGPDLPLSGQLPLQTARSVPTVAPLMRLRTWLSPRIRGIQARFSKWPGRASRSQPPVLPAVHRASPRAVRAGSAVLRILRLVARAVGMPFAMPQGLLWLDDKTPEIKVCIDHSDAEIKQAIATLSPMEFGIDKYGRYAVKGLPYSAEAYQLSLSLDGRPYGRPWRQKYSKNAAMHLYQVNLDQTEKAILEPFVRR